MSEHALQVAVAHMLQIVLDPERTWWSGIDHAAKLSARYGGDRKRRGIRPGLPDFIIMPQNMPVLGIELKTNKGKLSPPQIETAVAWIHMGHNIHVARSLEEVQEILEFCHVPMRRRMVFFPKQGSPYDGGAPARRKAVA